MNAFMLARQLLEDAYKYATTDIELESHLGDFIIDWGRLQIPEDALAEDGREDRMHVTVKYGLVAKAPPPELQEIAKATKPFVIFMGNVSLFTTNPDFDVVKIDVESPELHRLNKAISEAVQCEDTHPTYKPHVTIAYVQKGSCDHLNGEDVFKDDSVPREFLASGMRFKGAGDEDDPERVVTMLLFSKTAKVDRALAMAESVQKLRPYAMQARAMVEVWHRQGLDRDDMRQRLREGQWPRGMEYWHNRRSYPNIYNDFVREAITQIDEIITAGVEVPDPFGGLGFPADSTQTKFFLRSKSGRAVERPVL